MSRKLAGLPDDFRSQRIDNLSDCIGLVGPRLLVPVMASIVTRRRLNGLAAEALAVAVVTDRSLVVSTEHPLIRDVARGLGIECRPLTSPA